MTEPIVVSNAGSLPTTRQMALAVTDKLSGYYTAYWPGKRGSWLLHVPRLGRQVARRKLPHELAAHARSLLAPTELTRVALNHAGVVRLQYRLIWRRNVEFDRLVARFVPREATVISHYGASLETFRQVRRSAGRSVLDYPIARLDATEALLAEEAALHPDFADSIMRPFALTVSAPELQRLREEVDEADLVVVGSRFAAESFDGIVERERLVILPYGVETSAFKPSAAEAPRGPLRVLFAGQLSLRKGVVYLLEALRLLDPAKFELTLVGPLLGRGELLRRYDGKFRHLSGVRPQDMPDVYRQADVAVLPSLVEGSALVVLEAMASGIPVIVTPNAGADALRDGVDGFVVPIRSPEEIAERLDRLAENPGLRVEMGRAARERALNYDWSVFHEAVRAVVLGSQANAAEGVCLCA